MASVYILGIIFNASAGIGGEEPLTLGHQTFQSLNVLSLGLVVEHVGDILSEDLLATCTGVDTDHGDADGPRRVPDGHLQVGVTRLWIQTRPIIREFIIIFHQG